MGFQADLNPPSFSNESSFLERIFNQDEIFFLGRPLGLDAFIGVDDRNPDFCGDSNGQLDVFAMYIRPA